MLEQRTTTDSAIRKLRGTSAEMTKCSGDRTAVRIFPVEDQRLLPDEATSTPLPIPVLCATSIVGRAVLPGHAQLATLTTDSATAHEAAIPR